MLLYDYAGIQIHHGDNLDILPELHVVVDAIITDPPYGSSDGRGKAIMRGPQLTTFAPGEWDTMLPLDWIPAAMRLLRDGAWYGVFTDKLSVNTVWEAFEAHGGRGKQTFHWIKTNKAPTPRMNFKSCVESAVCGTKGAVGFWNGGGNCNNYIAHPMAGNGYHPTEKPEPVMAYLIRAMTKPGDVVLDPFGGSGTTAVACQRLNRRCIVIEKEREYCDVAIERLQQQSLNLWRET